MNDLLPPRLREYLDRMTPEERERNAQKGIAGLLWLMSKQIEEGNIIVDGGLWDRDGEVSFKYIVVNNPQGGYNEELCNRAFRDSDVSRALCDRLH